MTREPSRGPTDEPPTGSPLPSWRWRIGVWSGLVLVLTLLIGLGARQVAWLRARLAAAPVEGERPRLVRVGRPVVGEAWRTVPAIATVKSAASIRLPAEMAGRLIALPYREGDRVMAGAVLATIDPSEARTQVQAATAQTRSVAEQAAALAANLKALQAQRAAAVTNEAFWQSEARRYGHLFQRGAIARSQFDEMNNRLAEAQSKRQALDAQIEALRAQQAAIAAQQEATARTAALWKVREGYSTLLAPVAGVIAARLQEEGQFVAPGTPVYLLEDESRPRLLMQVPQERAAEVQPGQDVLVEPLRGGPASCPAFRVARIHPSFNEWRQVTVEATTEGPVPGLVYDRQGAARIITARQRGLKLSPGLVFPLEAAASAGAPTLAVFEVQDGQARRRLIEPLLIGDTGEVVVALGSLATDARLVSGEFLGMVRWPASFPVEVLP
jgi:multidrug efflux pump subunit AcrA (membrane-fusion protein)